MAWKAEKPILTSKQSDALNEIVVSRTSRHDHLQRANIVLLSAKGCSDREIARELTINRMTVGQWRRRWLSYAERLSALDAEESGIDYKRSILNILSDAPRPGTPCKFTPEQICQIVNVACERPEDLGLPFTHWSLTSLSKEVVKREIVDSISTSQLAVFLKSGRCETAQSERVDSYADRR